MGAALNICSISHPYSRLSVGTSLSLPEMTSRVVELCKELFKNWSNWDDSCFQVETVSGGIKNLLPKVSMKAESGDTESVTVRLFGTNTDYVINREPELQAIKYLSAAGFGAKLLSVFANGMVQSFINAHMRIPNLSAQIAKELHRFHQVEIPASLLEFADGEKQRKYQTISFTEIHDELVELKELTGRLNSPVVYAHNDLLCGNVMVNDEEGTDHWQGQIDTSENDGAVTCPTCLRELSMVEATKTDHEQQ